MLSGLATTAMSGVASLRAQVDCALIHDCDRQPRILQFRAFGRSAVAEFLIIKLSFYAPHLRCNDEDTW